MGARKGSAVRNDAPHRQKLSILKSSVSWGLISSQMAVYGFFCF
ncbi:hypothetical protein AX13_14115 [Comamonas aquatica DA1877]|uniref:Uncharacterized protein n=1 Tax=Comamonas aquatica DA1877 TaxID=1457173 RepID=A0A014QCK5_9BURK|nr:hypothetical protein AX13_14115 [Comamonas aquatica DA1877]